MLMFMSSSRGVVSWGIATVSQAGASVTEHRQCTWGGQSGVRELTLLVSRSTTSPLSVVHTPVIVGWVNEVV